MKQFLSLLLVLALCLSFCACGQTEKSADPTLANVSGAEKNDESFLRNLSKALEARWVLEAEELPEGASSTEYLTSLIDAETGILGSYGDYTFADATLAEYAGRYFAGLDRQREGIPYFGNDWGLYGQVFSGQGYNQCAKALFSINGQYGLSVSDGYASQFQALLTRGEKNLAVEALLTQPLILNNLGNDMEMVIENTTGFDLSSHNLVFEFLDENGSLLGSLPYGAMSWPAGSQLTVTIFALYPSFAQIRMSVQDVVESSVYTEPVPVEYVDEMQIFVTCEALPKEVHKGSSDYPTTSCQVTDFRFEVTSWEDGKAALALYFTATKTFDRDETTGTSQCAFVYKLLDENGNVIDTNILFSDLFVVKVGDTFQDFTYTDYVVLPGSYTLVLENYQ